MNLPHELLEAARGQLLFAFLVFLRTGAAMATLPAFGEQTIPQRIRLALALGFALVILPVAGPLYQPLPNAPVQILSLAAVEILAGLALGISLRFLIHGLQTAGAIAAQSTSLSQIFGNSSVDPQPAIGHILVIAGLALAVTAGLHVQIAQFLIVSYEFMPPGQHISGPAIAEWGTARVAHAFALAVSIAAPFVIAAMVYNVAIGAINRAMPQLMVSFVGAPAITAAGVLILFLCAPFMLEVWHVAVVDFLDNPADLPR